MKKLVLLGISAVLLTACDSGTETGLRQLETHDGYMVECLVTWNGGGSCDWEHQVKK